MTFRPGAEGPEAEAEFGKAAGIRDWDRPRGWRDSARCRNLPVEESDAMFFPYKGKEPGQEVISYCEPCPVRVECLSLVARRSTLEGVFGGWSHTERRAQFKRLGSE